VTLFICHVGIEVTGQIVHNLMDGVDPEDLTSARTAAATVVGVHTVVVRGRWMGRSLILDVDGQLDDDLPVSVARDIGRRVEQVIQQAVPAARTVRWVALAVQREAQSSGAPRSEPG
jgi:divalent metal cation (Fe/Co/Zn/Cd) transporter